MRVREWYRWLFFWLALLPASAIALYYMRVGEPFLDALTSWVLLPLICVIGLNWVICGVLCKRSGIKLWNPTDTGELRYKEGLEHLSREGKSPIHRGGWPRNSIDTLLKDISTGKIENTPRALFVSVRVLHFMHCIFFLVLLVLAALHLLLGYGPRWGVDVYSVPALARMAIPKMPAV